MLVARIETAMAVVFFDWSTFVLYPPVGFPRGIAVLCTTVVEQGERRQLRTPRGVL